MGRCFKGRECFKEERIVIFVKHTDDRSSQTGFGWPLDLIRGRLLKKRAKVLVTLTEEMSVDGGDRSQTGVS